MWNSVVSWLEDWFIDIGLCFLLEAIPLDWGSWMVLFTKECVYNSSIHLYFLGAEEVGSQWYVYTC